jgi:hypothetical protein
MIAIMGAITTLLGIAAAIALFARMRSKAAGLFLFGTLITPALPFISYFLGLGGRGTISYSVVLLSIGPLCAGIGLLWHALTTPKPATTNASPEAPVST